MSRSQVQASAEAAFPQGAAPVSRRRFLKTAFCSSAALGLALRPRMLSAGEAAVPGAIELLALGDFGSEAPAQMAVASAMRRHVETQQIRPAGLLMLGDNFYGKLSGVNSSRWRRGFSEPYPKSHFPGPCWAILGNHDYRDTPNGPSIQLARAARGGTRWTMPAKWYRVDVPGQDGKPLLTLLCLDTNLPSSRPPTEEEIAQAKEAEAKGEPVPPKRLTKEEHEEQVAWLKAELAKPRAPWTFILGHHPVYSNGQHGDSPKLIEWLDPLLREHRIPLYLCGHDHDLQHLEFEGRPTSFVLSGGGGARIRPIKREDRGPYCKTVHGFSHISLTADTLTLRHIDPNGKQLHGFTKTKDGKVSLLS